MRVVCAVSAVAGVVLAMSALAAPAGATPGDEAAAHNVHTCAAPAAGFVACDAIRHVAAVNSAGSLGVVAPATVAGWHPADLQAAYSLTQTSAAGGAGRTVAVVDAYDDPYAEQDLGVYRSEWGLPACTTANGCFRKVNQTGGKNLPAASSSWATEISLDLDMVSAICPNCKILLVEASGANWKPLLTAEDTAASAGPVAITNSWSGAESSSETGYDSHFNHPGVAITASSGDGGYGYGTQYPAASPYVLAVGGTSLSRDTTTGAFAETAWSGSTSGCSTYEPAPVGQSTVATGCSKRAFTDVSAIGDPNTGVAVYDTYPSSSGATGWQVYGGTSAASPIVASTIALAGPIGNTTAAAYVYAHRTSGTLNDITTGSSGTCPTTQWCTAGPGWDGPTGLGTPNGTSAF